jgi:GMP synthase-like glutamine amidotransferase
MRVHWLQHAAHEELGCIAPWLAARNAHVRRTRLYDGDSLPAVTDFDWLIVMGGPMNIYEHDRYPWLIPEKKLIRDACVTDKKVLGVCLGAQLLADVLGGRTSQNRHQEIGFFDVSLTEEGEKSRLFTGFPPSFPAFHWHGDTFALPHGAPNLLKSDACVNQAFAAGDRRLGLQFHLEVTYEDAQRWLAVDAPAPDRYVQPAAEILRDPERFAQNNRWMERILEGFVAA